MIKVKNFVTDYKVEDLLAINESNMMESLISQPANYATAALAHSQAFFQAGELKTKKVTLEAQLDEKIRSFYNAGLIEGAPDAKTKTKLTEAQISAKITSDPAYIAISDALNEAESYLKHAEGMLEAMKQRRDVLNYICNTMMEHD